MDFVVLLSNQFSYLIMFIQYFPQRLHFTNLETQAEKSNFCRTVQPTRIHARCTGKLMPIQALCTESDFRGNWGGTKPVPNFESVFSSVFRRAIKFVLSRLLFGTESDAQLATDQVIFQYQFQLVSRRPNASTVRPKSVRARNAGCKFLPGNFTML